MLGVSALFVLLFPNQRIIEVFGQAQPKSLQYVHLRLVVGVRDIATQREHPGGTIDNGGEPVEKVIQFLWRKMEDVFEAIKPEPDSGVRLKIICKVHAETKLENGCKQQKAVLYGEVSWKPKLAKLALRTAITQIGFQEFQLLKVGLNVDPLMQEREHVAKEFTARDSCEYRHLLMLIDRPLQRFPDHICTHALDEEMKEDFGWFFGPGNDAYYLDDLLRKWHISHLARPHPLKSCTHTGPDGCLLV